MKQTINDYIREHEDLHNILLAQEGGIMKYLAEHLDANGTAELFRKYQDKCVEDFFEKNKWDLLVIWDGAKMKRAALGEMEHLWKELRYQRILNEQLTEMPDEITEKVTDFTEQYLTYAYQENWKRWNPDVMSNYDVYEEVKGLFHTTGKAYKCMKLLLKKYHSNADDGRTDIDMLTAFGIRQYVDNFTHGYHIRMRTAIAELLDGKSTEECVQLAIDMMMEVRAFAQRVYNKGWVQYLRDIKFPTEDSIYFEKTGKHLNLDCFLIGAEEKERDGKWLREESEKIFLTELSSNVRIHSLHYYFKIFLSLLNDLGTFWAAQLLVRGFDMHKLEEEYNCILNPATKTDAYDENEAYYRYYIDRLLGDQRGDCCVYSIEQAKELLDKIKRNKPICVKEISWEDEKRCFKDAVLHIMNKKGKDGDYLFKHSTQWKAVYRFAIDFGIMHDIYDPKNPTQNINAQYAAFENFVHNLQLDVNPPTRIPFTRNAINSLSKKNYERYNQHFQWPEDGIKSKKSQLLYEELKAVYINLKFSYNKLIRKTERALD